MSLAPARPAGIGSHSVALGSALVKENGREVVVGWLMETTVQTIDNSIGLCYIGFK